MITTLNEFLGQPNMLYHALDFNKLEKFLKDDIIPGYSYQRYWKDGLMRKDNDPDYNNSNWYKGISTTRDMNFAKEWSHTFIVLDQDKIKQDYKVVPYQWNYSIGADYVKDHKKEREEFIITGYEEDENMLHIPKGSIKPLSKYIIGFYLSDYTIAVEKEYTQKLIGEFEDLYLGLYRDREREEIKNYMNKQGDDISNIKKQLKQLKDI